METNYEPGGPHDALERDLYEGEGIGHDTESDHSSQDGRSQDGRPRSMGTPPSSPPGSPRQQDFAPRGPVRVRGFRNSIPMGLHIDVQGVSNLAKNIRLQGIHGAYSTVVDSVAHAKQARSFIEELKFLVISSQLCDDQPAFGPLSVAPLPTNAPDPETIREVCIDPWTSNGAVATTALSFIVTCLVRWFMIGGTLIISLRRVVISGVALSGVIWALRIYLRRQRAKYIHEQTLNEMRRFVRSSSDFDSLASSSLSFILEVELVARGYRLSLPLPPVSRMENNGQALKSLKLRTALDECFQQVIDMYYQTAIVIREFADSKSLAFNDTGLKCDTAQIQQYIQNYASIDPEDAQKTAQLRESLKISRDTRKMFLVGLMSFDANGSKSELQQYTTALEGLQKCHEETQKACTRLKLALLSDRDMDQDAGNKSPLSPRHMKWKHQIMKVGDMNMSIRSIQAKMSLLLEESKRTLDNADDVSELGQMFMGRYEGIGKDIMDLMEAWEAGKSSLASTIDKNERRVSSFGSVASNGFGGSKIPVVQEDAEEGNGSVADAWDKLTGGEAPPAANGGGLSPTSPMFSPSGTMETFEAIATSRPRSMLTRQERIQKAHEDRATKLVARERALQQGWVMGELKDVLKSRGLNSVVNPNTGQFESLAPRLPVTPTYPRKPNRVLSMPPI